MKLQYTCSVSGMHKYLASHMRRNYVFFSSVHIRLFMWQLMLYFHDICCPYLSISCYFWLHGSVISLKTWHTLGQNNRDSCMTINNTWLWSFVGCQSMYNLHFVEKNCSCGSTKPWRCVLGLYMMCMTIRKYQVCLYLRGWTGYP